MVSKVQNQLTFSIEGCSKSFKLEKNSLAENNFIIKISPINEFLLIKPNFSELIIQTESIDGFSNLIYVPDHELDQSIDKFDLETLGVLKLESSFIF